MTGLDDHLSIDHLNGFGKPRLVPGFKRGMVYVYGLRSPHFKLDLRDGTAEVQAIG
jgi:hypothetical protein